MFPAGFFGEPAAASEPSPQPLSPGLASVGSVAYNGVNLFATNSFGGTQPYAYQWQRRIPSGSWASLSGAIQQGHTDTTVTPGESYFYRRRTTDAASTIVFTNEVGPVTIPLQPLENAPPPTTAVLSPSPGNVSGVVQVELQEVTPSMGDVQYRADFDDGSGSKPIFGWQSTPIAEWDSALAANGQVAIVGHTRSTLGAEADPSGAIHVMTQNETPEGFMHFDGLLVEVISVIEKPEMGIRRWRTQGGRLRRMVNWTAKAWDIVAYFETESQFRAFQSIVRGGRDVVVHGAALPPPARVCMVTIERAPFQRERATWWREATLLVESVNPE